jgi:hypothetical protein
MHADTRTADFTLSEMLHGFACLQMARLSVFNVKKSSHVRLDDSDIANFFEVYLISAMFYISLSAPQVVYIFQ